MTTITPELQAALATRVAKFRAENPDKTPCDRCSGAGIYASYGTCFRCAGKGWQSEEDIKRNDNYDNYGPNAQAAVAEAQEVPAIMIEGFDLDKIGMVTGHRDIKDEAWLKEELIRINDKLGLELCISGGAKGADTVYARAAVAAEKEFILLIPNWAYPIHYNTWRPTDKMLAHDLCVDIKFVVDRPMPEFRLDWDYYEEIVVDPSVMRFIKDRWNSERWWLDNFARNRAMIDAAGHHIAVSKLDPRQVTRDHRGGTNACIRELKKAHKDIVWVNPETKTTALIRWQG